MERIGEVAQRVVTDLSAPSIENLPSTLTEADLGKLPAKWERQDIDWLLSISKEVELPEMCSEAHAHKILRMWAASCAKRADDDDGGEMKGRLYARFLVGLTKARADELAKDVLLNCKFFPSIAELNEMTEPPASEKLWTGAWATPSRGKPTERALAAETTLFLIREEVQRRAIEKR